MRITTEFAMQMKIVKKNIVDPRVRFSPHYINEIQEMTIEKNLLKAHKLAHNMRGTVDIHVPKKYNEVANKYVDFVMYTLGLEKAFIKIKLNIEQIRHENAMEENKRWRFIFDLFERHNLDETVELAYMEE